MRTNIKLPIWLSLIGAILVLTACSGADGSARSDVELAPVSVLPDRIRQAPPTVQEAYRFAVVNQELVGQFPCYCGCVHAGHQSNLACYVQDVHADGTIVFDDHAFG